MRFKRVHFLSPKGPFWGVPHMPKIDSGYGPGTWPVQKIKSVHSVKLKFTVSNLTGLNF